MPAPVLRAAVACGLAALLGSCTSGEPTGLGLSFSSHASVPVVLTGYRLNGHALMTPPVPDLVAGVADVEWPRVGNGHYALAYPRGTDPDVLTLELEWVELLSGRAWRAEADVPISKLSGEAGRKVEVMPIFGADGLLIISSDPVPTSTGPEPVADVLRLCGTRVPEADQADIAQSDAIIGVADWMTWWRSPDAIRSTSVGSECTPAGGIDHDAAGRFAHPTMTE